MMGYQAYGRRGTTAASCAGAATSSTRWGIAGVIATRVRETGGAVRLGGYRAREERRPGNIPAIRRGEVPAIATGDMATTIAFNATLETVAVSATTADISLLEPLFRSVRSVLAAFKAATGAFFLYPRSQISSVAAGTEAAGTEE